MEKKLEAIAEAERNLEECWYLWSKHSCDCLGFEISYWQKVIRELTNPKG